MGRTKHEYMQISYSLRTNKFTLAAHFFKLEINDRSNHIYKRLMESQTLPSTSNLASMIITKKTHEKKKT